MERFTPRMDKLLSKRLETCFTAATLILLLLPITLPYALWNLTLTKKFLVNDKITAFLPTSIISNVTNNTNEHWKTVRLTSFQNPTTEIRFNLLHVCPFVPTFVFAVLLLPSFNVLSGYFFVSLNSVAVPTVRILIEFVTQLL